MKTYRLNVVYFLAGLANILADQFCADSLAGFLTKVLLMPLLALILLIPKSRFTPIHILTFTALVFSWAGDILLEFTGAGELFFLAGLLSFMVTQILYSVIFAKTMGTSVTASMLPMVLPVLVYGMRVPVIIYSLVILTMLALALIRAVSGSAEGRYLVLTGAILFVMSDSLIAISRFAHPIAGSGILIMATYITGQFLIIKGIKSHVKT
jgi:uncharacterized membrane protein YhhN